MAEAGKQLKIKDLPPDITQDKLKIILSNKKRRGGGRVERVDLNSAKHSAVVTFLESEAVNIILGRGNQLKIGDHTTTLYRLDGAKCTSTSLKEGHLNKPILNQNEVNQISSKSFPTTTRSYSSSESSETEDYFFASRKTHSVKKEVQKQKDEESSSDLEGATPRMQSTPCNLYHQDDIDKYPTDNDSPHDSESSQSKSEEDSNEDDNTDDISSDDDLSLAEKAERTVKLKIIDVTKSKDFYSLYLEDESINEGQFNESTMLLDGMRKHLFVTFKDARDARALCRISHDKKSNISEVTQASEKDFNWHTNLIAIHGFTFDSSNYKDKFKLLISRRLKRDVVEILQYDEKRSVIVKLRPEQCQQENLAKMIWKCSFQFCGIHLIPAPVEKSNKILISCLSSKTDKGTIERYLSNRRSGGSPGQLIPPIQKLSSQKAVATFMNSEAIETLLSKSKYELEGKKLKIDYFHHCLTSEAYEEHFGSAKKIQKMCHKISSEAKLRDSIKFGDGEINDYVIPNEEKFHRNKKITNKSNEKQINSNLKKLKGAYKKDMYPTSEEEEKEEEEEEKMKKLRNNKRKSKEIDWTSEEEKGKKLRKKIGKSTEKYPTSEEEEIEKKLRRKNCKRTKKCRYPTSEEEEEEIEKKLRKTNGKSRTKEKNKVPFEDSQFKKIKQKTESQKKHKNTAPEIEQTMSNKRADKDQISKTNNAAVMQESVPLNEHEREILQTLHFFKDINVETDFQGEYIMIKGTEKDIKEAKKKISEKILKFEKTVLNVTHVNTASLDLLKKLGIRSCINKKLKKKGHAAFLESKDDNVILHSFPNSNSSSPTELIAFVKEQIELKERPCGQAFSIFQSPKGSEFITKLCGNKDSKTCSVVRLEPKNESILIVALRKCMHEVLELVEQFMKENQIHTERFMISKEEQEFFQRFMPEEYNHFVDNMSKQGVSLDCKSDKIILQGSQDVTSGGIKVLSILRDKVAAERFELKYFGIRDFLSASKGKKLVDEFEKINSCLIREVNFQSSGLIDKTHDPGSVPFTSINEIASCKMRNCDIIFACCNILDLTVEAIVNPYITHPLTEGEIGKAILKRGGVKVEDELKRHSPSTKVKITSGGALKNVKRIIHFAPSNLSGNFDDAKEILLLCLGEANKHNMQSLAIPFMVITGLLKIGKFGVLTAIVNAIQTFLDEEGSSCQLNKIFLCDMRGNNVVDIKERCEAVWQLKLDTLNAIQDFGNKKYEKSFAKARKQRHEISKFGPVKVDVKKSKITKSDTDAIVITITESLELRKGKIGKDVLQYGGASIQDELRNKYASRIQSGEFVETKAGNLKSKLIMHACLSRYHGKKTELVSLVQKLLKRANDLNLSSISLPALGTGGYKYPAQESALAIKEGISRFVSDHKNISLTKIDIIIFHKDTETAQTFFSIFSGENDEREENEDVTPVGFDSTAVAGTSKNEGNNSKITYGSVTLTVKCGDITKEACDAIVNGIKASMDLTSSGAVCKSILKTNGRPFQDECSSKSQEIVHEGVTVTTAGRLPCKKIIHINMDIFYRSLDKGLFKVLELAEQIKATSIAIPALGTAKKRADINKIKTMMHDAIEKFGSTRRNLTDIRLVIFKQEMVPVFIGTTPRGLKVRQVNSAGIVDPLTLTIFHKNNENCQKLIQSFTESCNSIFVNESKEMPNVKNLTEKQIKDLKREGLEKGILLNVDTAKGCIYLQGLKSNTSEIIDRVYELQIHATKQNLGRNTGSLWEYKTDDKWERFEPIINAELELSHKKYPICRFNDSKSQSYLIDFEKCLQFLLDSRGNVTGLGTEIRRRDLTKEEPVPDTWDSMKKDEDPKLVNLPPTSKEYQAVLNKLQLAQVPLKVKQIQRVQNKALYQQYAVKKREMDSRNPAGYENEKLLYHGTPVSKVDAINHSGFSRNYKSVAYFGDGAYFAVDPKYSLKFAKQDPTTKEHKMYQVRVLVGESVVTKEGDRALPNKPGKNYPYDSGTAGNGVIYIIFHDAQAYPEYLITFIS